MFELKNAFKNVKRNIKRYSIVGIIIFIISLISVVALIVNQSSQATVDYYLNLYGKEATIDIDPEQLRASFDPTAASSDGKSDHAEMPTGLTYDQYEQFADSDYVKSVSYVQMTRIVNEALETSDPDATEEVPAGSVQMLSSDGKQIDSDAMASSFNLIGSDNLEGSSYFADTANVLVDGEYPTNNNEILVSSDILDWNNLSIGDKIKFTSADDSSTKQSLTIVGTYESVSTDQIMMGSQNLVFTNYNTVSKFTDSKENITATYELTSYDVVDEFEQECYDKGLDEMYYVNNNQELLNQVIGPVESTMNLLNNVLIVVFIIGGAILIFVNILILRERKYEIGVLRALGMKTSKLTKSLMLEALIVALVAMSVATIVGIGFAQPISDALIASNATEVANGGPETTIGHGGMATMSGPEASSETVATVETSINLSVLAITLGINMILMLVTTFVASKFISRQQPNEILREQ